LPHGFSCIVAILGRNHFESPNICTKNMHKPFIRQISFIEK
jgi:hypothetical protein